MRRLRRQTETRTACLAACLASSLAAFLGATLLAAPRAHAYEDFSGTRALGMGLASRAWAVGDTGPLLNPSGISLVKSYSVEGAYGYSHRVPTHFLHASIVDSTSAFNIGGGIYYTYRDTQPAGVPKGTGHEAGASLSLPFGPYLALGGTVKYLTLKGFDALTPSGVPHEGGVTFDLGATLRPSAILSFAFVGTNLRDLQNSHATRGLGFGVALLPTPDIVVSVDARNRFTPDNLTNRKGTSVMFGAEAIFGKRIAPRVGGGYDSVTGNSYGTVGFSVVSEAGAFDAGFRYDLFPREVSPGVDGPRETFAGVSLRLFVPAMQTQPQ